MRKKKRKYHRRAKENSFMSSLDWTLDAKTGRDILIVLFFILGGLSLLSLFGLAGKVGISVFQSIQYVFGAMAYIFPFIIIAIGVELIRDDEGINLTPLISTILGLCFLSAIFYPFGGVVGDTIAGLLRQNIGFFGSYLILLALFLVSFSLATNISILQMIPNIKNYFTKFNYKINLPKARVFTTMGQGKNDKPAENVQSIHLNDGDFEYPSLNLLEISTTKASAGNIAKNILTIEKALKDFNIKVAMQEVNIGPAVTQYTFKPDEGVKLAAITARTNDLALALAAHPIRVEAPIPGKSAVGVEVPNKQAAIITLRDVMESDEMKGSKFPLAIPLGRDVAGKATTIDLEKMPHLLIAGSTGSGKSVCINGIITSFIMKNSPADLRLLLVDPKRVEFTMYNNIPHLLCPVINDADKTVNALKWMVGEMERRYKILQEFNKRNINEYNSSNPPDGKMPYIVVVVDELADLMSQAANEIEGVIVRLAQMARAVGIHLIVATQRPSVNVITGLIKANINARIAFAVASQIDSRTIIDQSGAEKLLGNGDLLFIGGEVVKPKRVQGVLASSLDVKSVTDFLKQKGGDLHYDESILTYKTGSKMGNGEAGSIGGDDDLYDEAKTLVIQSGKASASLLQRRLRVGYARAARLLDLLEQNNVIGPPDGAKPRDVLVDMGSDYSVD
ncbi:MAG: DNA translocase FtsK 4TM domain-containing protein [Patescibacteria group bacterium]|jgi:S-DNA-T family DNA segregation ATPase FtsK/SpoIIIE